ncbi:hypothetical protein N781_03595 [Pontibacillus halophilus JSM 076056 = DSM 19796]|uniref:Uncharacterized protein n=1 Tax=Pontibacillus halophilus JSM 076056 = DSM 19796 TaxID=1385510 RepID=A0A0A5GKA9_9BACI|nr:DUF6254 family protein [Pontibacillus halophilus]KGX91585.1 hypothetical protein N781_03595 [Pontibacillus halophilus JSM 076056 = DSM 19796]
MSDQKRRLERKKRQRKEKQNPHGKVKSFEELSKENPNK